MQPTVPAEPRLRVRHLKVSRLLHLVLPTTDAEWAARTKAPLTGCTGTLGRLLDGGPVPALDCRQHACFLLALRGEAGDLAAGDDGLAGRGVDDAGEDCAAMAATGLLLERQKVGESVGEPYTADTIPPLPYICEAISCRPRRDQHQYCFLLSRVHPSVESVVNATKTNPSRPDSRSD